MSDQRPETSETPSASPSRAPRVVGRVGGEWLLFGIVATIVLVCGALSLRAGTVDFIRATVPQVVAPKGLVQLTVQVSAVGGSEPGADATPLPDARVRVLIADDQERYLEAGTARTDTQGEVTFDDLSAGKAWLLVDAEGYRRVSRPVHLFAAHRVALELSLAQALKISVVDEDDRPLAGATVLVRDDDALPFGGLSDAQGERVFNRLGPAPWRVEVFARGYESARRDGVSTDQRILLRRLGSMHVHVIDTNGDAAKGAHVFIVGSALWPARRTLTDDKGDAVISGLLPGVYNLKAELGSKVSPELSGTPLERAEHRRVELRLNEGRTLRVFAVDEAPGYDQPVEGASVVLAESGLSSFPISATTGADGIAYLSPAPLGVSSVSVSAEGFVPRVAVPVPFDTSEPLRVELLKGATLRGTITDLLGRPIEGARVEVIGTDIDGLPIDATPLLAAYRQAHFEWSLQPLPLLEGGELGVTQGPVPFVNEALNGQGWTSLPSNYNPWISNFEGEFVAHPVPPGLVRALVRHPAYVEGLSEQVAIGPGGEAKVSVVLSPGGELLGRVLDEDDRPVAFARVRATAVHGSFENTAYAMEDGTFRFAAVPQEITLMLARPEEPTRFVTREVVRLEGDQRLEREFVLPAAREPITVAVTDSDRRPLDMAQVQVTSLDPLSPLRTTRFTDATGRVEIEDAAKLKVRLTVSAPGFLSYSKEHASAPGEIAVSLRQGVHVEGRVTAVRGRQEAAGAQVVLVAGARREVAYTDELGRYRFQNVPLGTVELTVSHPDYATIHRAVRITNTGRADRPFEVEDLNLTEAATLSGIVVGLEGEPVRGARVGIGFAPAVLAMGRLPPGFVVTDEEGRFELSSVPPGEHMISAYAVSVGRGQARVEVDEGQDHNDVVVTLDALPEDEQPNLSGGGLALTLGERDSEEGIEVVVVDVASGSEAMLGGLQPGDALLEVDGVAAKNMATARSLLNGKVGSDVVVVVWRNQQRLSFRLRREAVGR